MAQFTIYKSTDASAPALTGEAGSLVALLYACLVNGYGAKAGAGWTREFTGTNKAVFRPGAGARHYYQVIDDGSVFSTETYKSAGLAGYETMSTVDVGTRRFPDLTLYAVRKSVALSAAAVPWQLFADGTTAYLFIYGQLTTAVYDCYVMGGFTSYVVGDAYNSIVTGCVCAAGGTMTPGYAGYGAFFIGSAIPTATTSTSRAIPRGWTQLGTPVLTTCNLPVMDDARDTAVCAPTGIASPFPSAGSLVTVPIELREKTSATEAITRGCFRGLRGWGHSFSLLSDQGLYTATDGKVFLGLRSVGAYAATAVTPGGVLVETSATL